MKTIVSKSEVEHKEATNGDNDLDRKGKNILMWLHEEFPWIKINIYPKHNELHVVEVVARGVVSCVIFSF